MHVACSDLDSLQPHVSVERLDPGASASRQLVAEMMILAGEAVGLLGGCGSRSGSRGQCQIRMFRISGGSVVPAGSLMKGLDLAQDLDLTQLQAEKLCLPETTPDAVCGRACLFLTRARIWLKI